nr:hypothetical protein Iba_chr09aCG5290 [Ipomoea batatas]
MHHSLTFMEQELEASMIEFGMHYLVDPHLVTLCNKVLLLACFWSPMTMIRVVKLLPSIPLLY